MLKTYYLRQMNIYKIRNRFQKINCKFTYVCLNLIFYMKKFNGIMLSVIVIISIVSSAQVAMSIHDNRFVDPESNSNYQVYLQVVIRDADGQLLSVSEETISWIVTATFPDGVVIPGLVDMMMDRGIVGEKVIVIIDNVKYEKLQWKDDIIIDDDRLVGLGAAKVGMFGGTVWQFCGDFKQEYGNLCIPLLEARTPQIHIADGNVVTNQWTILRAMN